MRFSLLVTLILLGVNRPVVAQEIREPAPKVRVFASENGRFSFKVEVTPEKEAKSPALGTLMSWNPDGTPQIIWQHPLPNIPHRAMIFDGPPPNSQFKGEPLHSVVTIGNWDYFDPSTWKEGMDRHAVVTYGPKGIIWDYSIFDLMVPQQRDAPYGKHPHAQISRLGGATFSFSIPMVPDQPFGASHLRVLYNRAVLQARFFDNQVIEMPLAPDHVWLGDGKPTSGLKWIPPLKVAP